MGGTSSPLYRQLQLLTSRAPLWISFNGGGKQSKLSSFPDIQNQKFVCITYHVWNDAFPPVIAVLHAMTALLELQEIVKKLSFLWAQNTHSQRSLLEASLPELFPLGLLYTSLGQRVHCFSAFSKFGLFSLCHCRVEAQSPSHKEDCCISAWIAPQDLPFFF